jgi:hypothetical protein
MDQIVEDFQIQRVDTYTNSKSGLNITSPCHVWSSSLSAKEDDEFDDVLTNEKNVALRIEKWTLYTRPLNDLKSIPGFEELKKCISCTNDNLNPTIGFINEQQEQEVNSPEPNRKVRIIFEKECVISLSGGVGTITFKM